ncbi:MAG: DUF4124 domain-containing protein [Rhodoferax sp.]
MKILQKILTFTLASACVAASAQWQWIDKDGHKVFSDRAPPADILDKNILKRPAGKLSAAAPAPDAAAAADAANPGAAAPAAGAGGKPNGVDKDLEAKKKQAADAEAAKRKAEEERVTKAKIENCARAKQAKTTFDSGIRISRANATGEREIMDDAARAAEAKRIQGVIDTDCK